MPDLTFKEFCERDAEKNNVSALDTQVGGDHYKSLAIQPVEFIMRNNLDYATGNVIKYVVRKKGDKEKRKEDLHKAIHYIHLLAEFEGIDLG